MIEEVSNSNLIQQRPTIVQVDDVLNKMNFQNNLTLNIKIMSEITDSNEIGRTIDLSQSCRYYIQDKGKFCGEETNKIGENKYCEFHHEVEEYKKSPDDVVMKGQDPEKGFY